MLRLLAFAGLAVLVLALLAGVLGWLAYGTGAPTSGEMTVAGLSAPVSVAADDPVLDVEAASLADLAAGLGYAHAARDPWPMLWLRQSARGTAAAWLGDSLDAVDAHARRLGLETTARAAYLAMSPPDRALLDAYAHGVNRALAQPGVAYADALVLAGVEPEPWEPWDALAVERLVAWAGTPAPWADSSWDAAREASAPVRAFARADSAFRASVGLGGAEHGRVYAAPSSEGEVLVAQLALGTTADALLVPTRLTVAGRTTVAVTVPGTLLLPVGHAADGTWGLLPTSRASVAPLAGRPPPPVYSRVVQPDGSERLVAARRDARGLLLGSVRRDVARPAVRDTAQADTTHTGTIRPDSIAARPAVAPDLWRVAWAGFGTAADGPALFRLAAGDRTRVLRLFAGTGLRTSDGVLRVVGRPRVAVTSDSLALVSDALAARAAFPRLAALSRAGAWPITLADDAVSPTDVARLRALLAAMGARDSLVSVLQEPYSYLASWDGAYAPDAIGATLYETWMEAHASVTGRPPAVADTLDRLLLPWTLRLARAQLRDRYGVDPAAWRWGRVAAGLRHPVLGARHDAAARAYRLAPGGGRGHPSALRPGPLDGTTAGPAVWSAWVSLRDGTLFVQAPRRRGVTEDEVETARARRGRTSVATMQAPPDGERLRLLPP